jgi:S1-C subfamily serine protease
VSRIGTLLLALGVLVPTLASAVAPNRDYRLNPRDVSQVPTFVQRVQGAIVGLRVRVDEGSPSAATLGTQRFASGVIFDPRGFVLTVSYVLLDAVSIDARTRDDRVVKGRLVGIDFDSGLGVVKLDGEESWPVAPLGQSRDVIQGALTGTVGVDEEGTLVWVSGTVQPHVNLAIPLEKFLPIKDELISLGRVASRPARPWLGLYTVDDQGGPLIDGFSPVGPARGAGLQKGDRIIGVSGVRVRTQAEFYEQLWRAKAGDVVALSIQRGDAVRIVPVRSVDRYQLYRTTPR